MTTPITILAFAGSTRRDSLTKKLSKVAAAAAEAAGAHVTWIDLKDYPIPLYDGDLEAEQGPGPAVPALLELFRGHDALLVASPEYNEQGHLADAGNQARLEEVVTQSIAGVHQARLQAA